MHRYMLSSFHGTPSIMEYCDIIFIFMTMKYIMTYDVVMLETGGQHPWQ